MEPIVIIGSGLAGYTVAREFRKLNQTTPLTIVTRDGGAFYSKPMLSNALTNGKNATQLAGSNAEQMGTQLNAQILTRTHIDAIELDRQHLRINGTTLPYSSLVLALGADPIRLAIGGDATEEILSVNDLDDYAKFRDTLQPGNHVTLLGAGLIGCEFANDLAAAGHRVSVIDPATWPISRLLPETAGHALQNTLSEIGVTWQLGRTTSRVDRHGERLKVTLDDGSSFESDIVLSAVGLRPRTTLAQSAGLSVARGILVNRYLTSNTSNIFALGDCAEVEGLVLPFVMPIMQAARALAKNLNGEPTQVVYPAMPVLVKTPALPVVVCPPPLNISGTWDVTVQEDRNVRGLFRSSEGNVVGFALTGSATNEKQRLGKELPAWLAAEEIAATE